MFALARALSAQMWAALGGDPARLGRLRLQGEGALPGAFAVSDFAAAAVACAALAADELQGLASGAAGGEAPAVRVDRRLAALWFGESLRPQGWKPPPARDTLTGDHACADGWIRLHCNAPHHRAAACRVLGLDTGADAARAAPAVAAWAGAELEQAVVDAGGCAAQMRHAAAWRAHAQGAAVRAQPLVLREELPAPPAAWEPASGRPLRGLRVLDLTRVLAGPVSTRMLAGLGATVLRIDPPSWDEPGLVPDVTRGKHCARLDLKTAQGRERFEQLLGAADVFVHGLRPGALDALGLDPAARQALRPGLVDVCLDAYGWAGPWAARRGFDSLVQMSCGIAEAGMRHAGANRPVPLPVQALDHATGYLIAASVLRALARRLRHGVGTRARLSLARSGALLLDAPPPEPREAHAALDEADLEPAVEATAWGPARRIRAPWAIEGVHTHWERPASPLGSAEARWP
ncbi:CoA transferase [Thiomonas sp. FB-6]|uniref:CoA transferase n=1 Tax=Thiomonas sp. FB-6 TaxID=1158291 RepID=UPI000360554E|nr:CoA transferase [Thiomonas sp. FB-6]